MEYLSRIYQKMTKIQLGLILVAAFLLYGFYFFGLHPLKKMAEIRNSQRRSDVTSILNAVYTYSQDHNGELPAGISESPTLICRTKAQSCEHMIDLTLIVTDKKYTLPSVPVDPRESNANSSGYQIAKSASGRLAVMAPKAENNASIVRSK